MLAWIWLRNFSTLRVLMVLNCQHSLIYLFLFFPKWAMLIKQKWCFIQLTTEKLHSPGMCLLRSQVRWVIFSKFDFSLREEFRPKKISPLNINMHEYAVNGSTVCCVLCSKGHHSSSACSICSADFHTRRTFSDTVPMGFVSPPGNEAGIIHLLEMSTLLQ